MDIFNWFYGQMSILRVTLALYFMIYLQSFLLSTYGNLAYFVVRPFNLTLKHLRKEQFTPSQIPGTPYSKSVLTAIIALACVEVLLLLLKVEMTAPVLLVSISSFINAICYRFCAVLIGRPNLQVGTDSN
jgi:membrane protein implicated in regulation of membrane protease activity